MGHRTYEVIQDTGRNETWIERTLVRREVRLIRRQLRHHMRTDRLPTTIALSE